MRDGEVGRAPSASAARWAALVDTALPVAWMTAQAQDLSVEDTTLVCEVTLLALLDRLGSSDLPPDGGGWATAQLARDVALLECRRTRRLNQLRTQQGLRDLTTIDLPEGTRR